MTMTDTGLTARERVEAGYKKVEQLAARIETLGDRANADDHQELADATDALATDLNELKAQERTRGVQGEARALLDELAGVPLDPANSNGSAIDRKASAAGYSSPNGRTFGELFVESEMYQQFQARNVVNGEVSGIGGNTPAVQFGVGAQGIYNLETGASDTSGGAFIEPTHLPGWVDTAEFRELTLWDLATKIPVSGDTFDYVEVDSKTNNAAPVPEATDAGDLNSRFPEVTVATTTDAAGGLKPESDLSTVKRTVTIEQIAHLMYVTRRAAADAPQLMAIINQFLREGLDIEVEDQLLLGDGTSPNLRGLINATNPYALNVFDMSVNAETSRINGVVRAASLVRTTSRRRPNAMLVNTTDWFSADFLLATAGAGNNHYILGDPRSTMDQLMSIWGLRVVATEAIASGTQVVGDFSQMVIGDRQQTVMYMSDSNRDLFERNILTLLAEKRCGVGVLRPKAFSTIVA